MKNNIFSFNSSLIINCFFIKELIMVYKKIIHFLFKSKWMARFLAHGGIHFILLISLGIGAYFMWDRLNKNNVTSYNQIEYTFYGDTLGNYKINYLCLKKDMRRRPDKVYNDQDIRLDVGYEKINGSGPNVKNTYKRGKKYLECDLVSKVRYVVRNNEPDTIAEPAKDEYKYLTFVDQLCRTEKKSNHDRYYYNISTLKDKKHIFYRQTNAIDHLIEWGNTNPNFSFRIGIIMDDDVKLNKQSKIVIKYNDFKKDDSLESNDQPLVFDQILPEPTIKTLTEIVYEGEQLKSVVKGKGIFISGTDLEKKEKIEKENLFHTVLLGTIIAFILDIFVQLIIKWRKLNDENN